MRKTSFALAALAALTLLVGTAAAQSQWPHPGENLLGLYTSTDGAGLANLDVNGEAVIYLIATRTTGPGGILGWECHLTYTLPAGVYATTQTLYGQALNVSAYPDFAVGLGGAALTADANGNIALAEFHFLVTAPTPVELFLGPSSRPSIPDVAVYAAGDNPGLLIPFELSSGSNDLACFGFNTGPFDPPIPVTQETFGGVKNLYR